MEPSVWCGDVDTEDAPWWTEPEPWAGVDGGGAGLEEGEEEDTEDKNGEKIELDDDECELVGLDDDENTDLKSLVSRGADAGAGEEDAGVGVEGPLFWARTPFGAVTTVFLGDAFWDVFPLWWQEVVELWVLEVVTSVLLVFLVSLYLSIAEGWGCNTLVNFPDVSCLLFSALSGTFWLALFSKYWLRLFILPCVLLAV